MLPFQIAVEELLTRVVHNATGGVHDKEVALLSQTDVTQQIVNNREVEIDQHDSVTRAALRIVDGTAQGDDPAILPVDNVLYMRRGDYGASAVRLSGLVPVLLRNGNGGIELDLGIVRQHPPVVTGNENEGYVLPRARDGVEKGRNPSAVLRPGGRRKLVGPAKVGLYLVIQLHDFRNVLHMRDVGVNVGLDLRNELLRVVLRGSANRLLGEGVGEDGDDNARHEHEACECKSNGRLDASRLHGDHCAPCLASSRYSVGLMPVCFLKVRLK